jgi:hypothetical protein
VTQKEFYCSKNRRIVETICKAAVLTIVGKQKHNKAAKAPVPFELRQPVVATLSGGGRLEEHFHCLLAKLQMEHDLSLLDC